MPLLNRMIAPRGPKFYEVDGALMFINVLDGSTRDGPREATDADKAAFPGAYREFEETPLEVSPFKPVITTDTPVRQSEKGPYAQRRDKAAAQG